jgi:uncharacterized protein YecE (DUF72 family)
MDHTNQAGYYSGTSNIVLPVPNKTMFPVNYQDKSRLCYYASLFNSLEVNSSFYKIPLARTVEKWNADVPDGFKFTFKLWRGITHNKGLVFDPADVARFIKTVANTGDRAGCLLVQFPASVTIAYHSQFERLLISLRENDEDHRWNIAIEFRSKTWYNDEIYELLDSQHCGMVIHDIPASATPLPTFDAGFVYLRFHGPEKNYRGSYTEDFLYEYAGYIKEWLSDGKTVYVYFNNTLGNALPNLLTLNDFVNP